MVGLCSCGLIVAVLHVEHIELALVAMREVLARDAMLKIVRITRDGTLEVTKQYSGKGVCICFQKCLQTVKCFR